MSYAQVGATGIKIDRYTKSIFKYEVNWYFETYCSLLWWRGVGKMG
jgi:hypothetical protein